MLHRLGYACVRLSVEDSSPRGAILRTATPARLRAPIAANLPSRKRVPAFNVEHQVWMFDLSSDLVPFESHQIKTLDWWCEFAERRMEIGDVIRRHDLRVSMHPGQYTVLSWPERRVVEAAPTDLLFHARLL